LLGETIVVWGQGARRNQYTHRDDIVDGIIAGMLQPKETFNLISPEVSTTRELVDLLAAEFGFRVEFDVSRKEGASMPYMSPAKAIQRLGWTPMSLREGVLKTMREIGELAEAG
jgi:nucleoside-diphosphate-sugar epimerase